MDTKNYTVIFPDSPPLKSHSSGGPVRKFLIFFLILSILAISIYFFLTNQNLTMASLNFKKAKVTIAPSITPSPTVSPLEWRVYENYDMGVSFNYPATLQPKNMGLAASFVKDGSEKSIFEVWQITPDQAAPAQNAQTVKTVDSTLGFVGPIKLLVNKIQSSEEQISGKSAQFEIIGFFDSGENVLKFKYNTLEGSYEKDLVTMTTILSTFKFIDKSILVPVETSPTGYPTIAPPASPTPTP